MKHNIRALGVDDSYFIPHQGGCVKMVGVVVRTPNYLEGVLIREIQVDGLDATDALLDMLSTRFGQQIKVIFTQGLTFGGFNMVDIVKLYGKSGIPVISVVRRKPDMGRIKEALQGHFKDWKLRYEILTQKEIREISNGKFKIYVQFAGIEEEEARKTIENFTVRGAMPEPLRMAHIIASALHFGESKGKI